MAYKIRWSKTAATSLEDSFDFIAHDSLKYAKIFAKTVRDKIRKIPANPRLFRKVPEINHDLYREVLYNDYRIIYKISPEFIEILLIRNGAKPLEGWLELSSFELFSSAKILYSNFESKYNVVA